MSRLLRRASQSRGRLCEGPAEDQHPPKRQAVTVLGMLRVVKHRVDANDVLPECDDRRLLGHRPRTTKLEASCDARGDNYSKFKQRHACMIKFMASKFFKQHGWIVWLSWKRSFSLIVRAGSGVNITRGCMQTITEIHQHRQVRGEKVAEGRGSSQRRNPLPDRKSVV